MKRVMLAILTLSLLFSLCACGGDDTAPDTSEKKVTIFEPTTKPTECPHEYADSVTTEASCTAEGEKCFTCAKCGDSYTEIIEKLAHTYADASCTAPKTCTICGATEGDALDHSYAAATCTTPKTCTICGATEGDAKEHSYAEATCTEPKTCVNCGDTSGKASGHKYTGGGCTGKKTCSVCGATKKNSHKYAAATCTAPKTCSACGETEGEALGHSYTAATCTTPKICTTCGTTEGEAPGHSYTDATCTTPKTCTACGMTEGEALGHTCDADGVCTVCGEQVEAAPENIPFEGHDWMCYVLHQYEEFEFVSVLYFEEIGLMEYQYIHYYNEAPPEDHFGTLEYGGKTYYMDCIGGSGSDFEFSVDGDTVTVWNTYSGTFVMTRRSPKTFEVVSSTYRDFPVGTVIQWIGD